MRLSHRARREWRIILWISLASAAISAWFGYAVAPAGDPPLRGMWHGVIASLCIATPIILLEFKGPRVGAYRRLRRLPLAIYFAVKVLLYFVIIVGGFLVMRLLTEPTTARVFVFNAVFRQSLLFSVGMAVFGNLVFDMVRLLGFGTLRNLLTGRYVQPKREQRAFLLIDMKNSTGMAERLGPVRFHELLNDFFRDVGDAALECDGEIHKYLGDEAILTWPSARALNDGDCLACPFIARDFIEANRARYLRRYGTVPQFRAACHYGEIVAGEIGDMRREIAYVGDTLNVVARLLDAAKQLGHEVLVSTDLLEHAALPADLKAEKLPTLTVRGRTAPLGIAALERTSTQ